MTLKGKTNHYNVKFLKGYGFSVKVKDSKIVLRNAYNPFEKNNSSYNARLVQNHVREKNVSYCLCRLWQRLRGTF